MVTLWLVAILAADLFSGVRSTVEKKGPVRPAREKDCAIEFVNGKTSARTHEVLATIQVYVRRNKITMGQKAEYEEAKPEFRKQACKLGADGVIVLQQTVSHSGEFKLLYVKGDAVRFTDKPPD
jgi:uncharacterized protein YbjQ (UPF0145 family)